MDRGHSGILRAQCPFCRVHTVRLQIQFRPLPVCQIPQVIFRNGDNGIRLSVLYLPERLIVTEIAAGHGQVFRRVHVRHHPPRQFRPVIIYHDHFHVLHVKSRHKGDYQHHQNGHRYYQAGDNRAALHQRHFFPEQYLQCICIHTAFIF